VFRKRSACLAVASVVHDVFLNLSNQVIVAVRALDHSPEEKVMNPISCSDTAMGFIEHIRCAFLEVPPGLFEC
jgi:hypothetical protein